MKLKDLRPGQTVYCVFPKLHGGLRRHGKQVMPVKIHRVKADPPHIQASWGDNPPRWHMEVAAAMWQPNKPKLKRK